MAAEEQPVSPSESPSTSPGARVGRAKRPGPIARIPPGLWLALPNLLVMLVLFAVPIAIIVAYAFTPSRSFALLEGVTLENFVRFFEGGYYRSLGWTFYLSAWATGLLLLICYPLAYGLAKVFRRAAPFLTVLFVMPLFISETVRLYGWSLFFLRGGILNGITNSLGLPFPELMYSVPVIVLGLVYIYLPFMLFPLVLGVSLIPDEVKLAARDLGANARQVFWRIELPLALPGIVVGSLLTFVMTLSSMSESRMLGGRRIVMMADDIEFAFGYQQNWPLGASLSVVLMVCAAAVLIPLIRRLRLDSLFDRR